ncbi:hypothetical protein OAU50_08460 [Planctomycetota bacterium]|nr:hypothetical protein [Planctomycetota bacterium]
MKPISRNVLIGLGTLILLATAYLWFTRPSHRIEKELYGDYSLVRDAKGQSTSLEFDDVKKFKFTHMNNSEGVYETTHGRYDKDGNKVRLFLPDNEEPIATIFMSESEIGYFLDVESGVIPEGSYFKRRK